MAAKRTKKAKTGTEPATERVLINMLVAGDVVRDPAHGEDEDGIRGLVTRVDHDIDDEEDAFGGVPHALVAFANGTAWPLEEDMEILVESPRPSSAFHHKLTAEQLDGFRWARQADDGGASETIQTEELRPGDVLVRVDTRELIGGEHPGGRVLFAQRSAQFPPDWEIALELADSVYRHPEDEVKVRTPRPASDRTLDEPRLAHSTPTKRDPPLKPHVPDGVQLVRAKELEDGDRLVRPGWVQGGTVRGQPYIFDLTRMRVDYDDAAGVRKSVIFSPTDEVTIKARPATLTPPHAAEVEEIRADAVRTGDVLMVKNSSHTVQFVLNEWDGGLRFQFGDGDSLVAAKADPIYRVKL